MEHNTRLLSLNTSLRATAPATAPPTIPPTFPRFRDFPCEIRLMIWREFFLEPRFFRAILHPSGRYLRSTLVHHGGSRTYYNSIDTQINKESSEVARKFRPKCFLPMFSPSPGTGDLVRELSQRYFHVNWDVDFINLDDTDNGIVPLQPQGISWYSQVRNLSLGPFRQGHPHNPTITPYYPGWPSLHRDLTKENKWLFNRRDLLTNLKTIIQCQNPSFQSLNNTASYFQTRYLLRESPKAPPQWKYVSHEVCSLAPWMILDASQPRWADFLEQLLAVGWEFDMEDLQDEIEVARLFFGEIN